MKIKPFKPCARFYHLSDDNYNDVNDCCYQSCYRSSSNTYYGTNEECLKNCQKGQETIAYMLGQTPCQWKYMKQTVDNLEPGMVTYYMGQGHSLEDARNLCLHDSKTEKQATNCLIDYEAYRLGNNLYLENPEPKKDEFQTKENFQILENPVDPYVKYWLSGILVFSIFMIIFIMGLKNILNSTQ